MFAHFGIKDFIDVVLVALLLFYLFHLVKISGMRPLFMGVLVFLIIWVLVSQCSIWCCLDRSSISL
jgi:glycerol uptake facilitator-like aquaporin